MNKITNLILEENTEIEFENHNLFLEDFMIKEKISPEYLKWAINEICTTIHYRAYGEENWDWFLYENLEYTLDTKKFIEKIKNNFKHYNLDIKIGNFDAKYKQFEIKSDKFKELANNKNFIELCDNANYEIIINKNRLTIKPIKGEDITNKVYQYPVIYHYCPKFIYEENIKKFGISPKGKSTQKPYESKYKRIYCFYSKDPMGNGIKSFVRLKKRISLYDYGNNLEMQNKLNQGFVLLTIDLSKYKERKIKFFEDSGQKD